MFSRAVVLIACVFVGACSETETVLLGSRIELAIDHLDFGEVPVGLSATQALSIKNISAETLLIRGFDHGPRFTSDRWKFQIGAASMVIEPGAVAQLEVTFEPYAETEASIESSFFVVTDFGQREIFVSAHGRSALRIEPVSLDFGRVYRGRSAQVKFTASNLLDIPLTIRPARPIGQVEGAGAFELAAGPTLLPAKASAELTVTYRPSTSPGETFADRARLIITYCEQSNALCETTIELAGRGTDEALECAPLQIDFGGVDPQETARETVNCRVIGPSTVSIDTVGVTGAGVGEVVVLATPALPGRFEPGQEISLEAAYTPIGSELIATMRIEGAYPTTGRAIAPVVIPLAGVRGRAVIGAAPARLDFGRVSIGTATRRTLLVSNSGTELLLIDRIAAIDPAFTVSGSGAGIVPVGGAVEFVIEFAPDRAGPVTSELLIVSNDPRAPQLGVPVTGEGLDLLPCQYEVSATDLDFGTVEVLRTRTLPVFVRNIGQDDCWLQGFTMELDLTFSLSSALPPDLFLRPGEVLELSASYRPEAVGASSGRLVFYVSDPAASYVEVRLSGSGSVDSPIIYPDAIDFGPVGIGCDSEVRVIRVHNPRPSVTIDSVELSSESATELSVTTSVQVPVTLAASAVLEVHVQFSPGASGPRFGTLRILENGAPRPHVVSIRGRGANGDFAEEHVANPASRNVDVLMMIDDSTSTWEEQQGISENFASFIAPADQFGVDYLLASVTADHDDNGVCPRDAQRPPGHPEGQCGYFTNGEGNSDWRLISRSDVPSPEDAFRAAVELGISGSGLERGLQNVQAALRGPLITGWNAGFLRPDAELAIIFMSDETDQSDLTTAAYRDYFAATLGIARRNQLAVHAIVGDARSGCSGPGGNAHRGDRYVEVSRALGGIFESVCTNDWAATMENIGLSTFADRTRFVLENQPVFGTLSVEVDGVGVPARLPSGQTNWSYDSAANAVRFSPFASPSPDEEIVIRYQTMCL